MSDGRNMMESIEKLREKSLNYAPNIRRDVNMALNEIEREIAERYTPLPVDADGEPIHVGDVVSLKGGEPFEVGGVRDTRSQWHVFPYDLQRWYSPLDLRHVKPRTVEDVLNELLDDYMNDVRRGDEDIIAKYAAELQMRGDAE